MSARQWIRRGVVVAVLGICAALGGCAGWVLEPGEKVSTRPTTAEALVAKVWTERPGVRFLRQTALFESGSVKVAADGLLRFDPVGGSARLVALNEVGLKLFDLTVTQDSVTENFLLPDLAKARGFSGAVATCLRAVFLSHKPRATDRLVTGPETYELTRNQGEGRLTSVFGGGETLLFKEYEGEEQSWSVRFLDYKPVDSLLMPGRTVFTDRRAGYRVSLWLREVKEAHE